MWSNPSDKLSMTEVNGGSMHGRNFALTIASALRDIDEIRTINAYVREITHASRGVIRNATSKNICSVVIRICIRNLTQ